MSDKIISPNMKITNATAIKIIEWIEENGLVNKCYWYGLYSSYDKDKDSTTTMQFYFNDEIDYIAFKLRWE